VKTYPNMAAALKDPKSNAASMLARFDAARTENDTKLAALVADGLTREQAWARLLAGGRS
jgi:hypothetical protein